MSTDYHCIAIDPPWPETGGGKKYKRGADRHYKVLKPHQILQAVVTSPLWRPADDCHLWTWTTLNSLPTAMNLIDALGFKYKTHIAWLKVRPPAVFQGVEYFRLANPGLGQYVRGVHELLLLAGRGRQRSLSRKVPSAILAERKSHSTKPRLAYEAMAEISPGPRAELFARNAREGWDCWGEVDGVPVTWIDSDVVQLDANPKVEVEETDDQNLK
jgi:N6-adenosine-specific RNA methylase IME4